MKVISWIFINNLMFLDALQKVILLF
jgi:hypothetical protein